MLDYFKNLFNSSSDNGIDKVKSNIEKIIENAELNSKCKYSCKDLIMEDFYKIQHRLENELKASNKNDTNTIAYSILYNLAFDNLSMGYYDYRNKSLNNFDCSDNLLNSVKKCLDYFEEQNIMNSLSTKIQLNNLKKNYSLELLTELNTHNKKLIVPPAVLAIEKAFFRIIYEICGSLVSSDEDSTTIKLVEFELVTFLYAFWEMIVVGFQNSNPDLCSSIAVMLEEEINLHYKNIINLFNYDIVLSRIKYYANYNTDYDMKYLFLNKFQPIMLFAIANDRLYNDRSDSRPVNCDINLTERLDILFPIIDKCNLNLCSFIQNGSFNSPYEETYKLMIDYR